LLGEIQADSTAYQLVAVFLTDNLLLNAYRQTKSGQDMFIALDTSYHYTQEKIGLMPMKTVSLTQDVAAHTFILENVKEAVKQAVK
jgi:hypothetical protein